ncbi:pyridoxine 5'-phosphate synthase [Allohahella marinimesophila]|uniref:Pyridoxine 5'-phosphate synthase n=1 Tax=Allohahella marinimesophila TaxID=1054972 RepID=A0ABP7Q5E5_9GAMM
MTTKRRVLLGVNIDHVATLRQARGTIYPDPVMAAAIAEQAGADSITVHPREDGRHIQLRDVRLLAQTLQTSMNLEMAATDAMLTLALEVNPRDCCIVPEKREELTTEGGLDVCAREAALKDYVSRLSNNGIRVSLFIDPDPRQIEASVRVGAQAVELHTGDYAEATGSDVETRLEALREAAAFAHQAGLLVNAGHGLHYHNTRPIAAMAHIRELNIGHAIIARAVLMGLDSAVREMRALMDASV